MKILIVGLGSIGRKHLQLLMDMENVQVAALRTSKGELQEVDSNVTEYYSLEEALRFQPDGVIISNPTALHAETALPFLKQGIKVLIEKPVAHTVDEAIKLEPFSHLIRVAYCLRFLPIYQKLQSVFKSETPFKVGFKRSFFLPKWHPYADYRNEYVARKELGGGVLRTFSHEIDLAISWFGTPISANGLTDKVSFLDIDTDDYAYFSLKYKKGLRINYELDLFSPVNINQGEAYNQDGKYTWNINQLYFQSYTSVEQLVIYDAASDELNLMYQKQMMDFIGFIETSKSVNTTFEEAIKSLKIIELIERDGS